VLTIYATILKWLFKKTINWKVFCFCPNLFIIISRLLKLQVLLRHDKLLTIIAIYPATSSSKNWHGIDRIQYYRYQSFFNITVSLFHIIWWNFAYSKRPSSIPVGVLIQDWNVQKIFFCRHMLFYIHIYR